MIPSYENLRHLQADPPPLIVRNIGSRDRYIHSTQYLTNTTYRGFHPVTECMVNLDIDEVRDFDRIRWSPQYIDYIPFASFTKSDLTMQYVYDTADVFLLGDELVTLPFVTYMYRRDPDLGRQEIQDAILEEVAPERYEDHSDDGPMSKKGFWKMM